MKMNVVNLVRWSRVGKTGNVLYETFNGAGIQFKCIFLITQIVKCSSRWEYCM